MNKICLKCIMDNSDKSITFDKDGVCNYCQEAEKQLREWRKRPLKEERRELVAKIKKEGKKYDCLIGMSGGIDGSMVAHYVKELGLKPFVLIFDNEWNTKLADDNVKKLLDKLGFDYEYYKFSKEQLRTYYELQIAFLVASVPNAEIPTDHILGELLCQTALKHKIKYIISGGNIVNEGTMPESWSFSSKDLVHIKAIYKKFIGKEMKGLPVTSLLKYLYYRTRIKTINLLDYYKYEQKACARLLKTLYGWQNYHAKHCESNFTMWYQEYYLPRKFGIDKRKAHLSSLIHSGNMLRDEALEEMKKPLSDHQDISREIMKRFQMTPQAFDKMMSFPIRSHLEYENSQWRWNFITKVYELFKRLSL